MSERSTQSLTHFSVQNIDNQILNVPGLGNCFYDVVRLGLQFHGYNLSTANVKDQILEKIQTLWDRGNVKFKSMFDTFVPTKFNGNPREYCKHMRGKRIWASYLEIYVCSLHFNMNILTFTVRQNSFQSSRSKMLDMFNISINSRFDFHIGHVSGTSIGARLHETRLNHFVFLRPPALVLDLHSAPNRAVSKRIVQAVLSSLRNKDYAAFKSHFQNELRLICNTATINHPKRTRAIRDCSDNSADKQQKRAQSNCASGSHETPTQKRKRRKQDLAADH